MKIKNFILLFFIIINISFAETILLNGVETTGVSSGIKANNTGMYTMACHFVNSGGSVTALTVNMEGSIDYSHWYNLKSYPLNTYDTAEIANAQAMFHVVNKDVNYIRANITTLTETGTTAVYVSIK